MNFSDIQEMIQKELGILVVDESNVASDIIYFRVEQSLRELIALEYSDIKGQEQFRIYVASMYLSASETPEVIKKLQKYMYAAEMLNGYIANLKLSKYINR